MTKAILIEQTSQKTKEVLFYQQLILYSVHLRCLEDRIQL